MGNRVLAVVVTIAVAAALVLLGAPQWFGLAQTPPLAQLVAFRSAAAAVLLVVATVLLVVALLAQGARRLSGALTILILVFVAATAGVQVVRGFVETEPTAAHLGDLRVLSWNTQGAAPGIDAIARTALDSGATVVSLPETSAEDAQAVADVMAAAEHPVSVFTAARAGGGDPDLATSVLVSSSLGAFTQDTTTATTTALPSVVLRPESSTLPVIVAVHAAPPTRELMPEWSRDLDRIAEICSWGDVLVAGDLNATLDHFSGHARDGDLGDCVDAGRASGGAAIGTWPASVPRWFSTTIDHVLFSGDRRASGYTVIDSEEAPGSDHRPVLAQISVAGLYKGLSR